MIPLDARVQAPGCLQQVVVQARFNLHLINVLTAHNISLLFRTLCWWLCRPQQSDRYSGARNIYPILLEERLLYGRLDGARSTCLCIR